MSSMQDAFYAGCLLMQDAFYARCLLCSLRLHPPSPGGHIHLPRTHHTYPATTTPYLGNLNQQRDDCVTSV